MSLHITRTENVFQLAGNLTGNQVFQIRNFFKTILNSERSLEINLSGLDQLDLSAAMMFQDLKELGLRANKKVTVTNGENRKILGAFRMLGGEVLAVAA